MTNASSLLASFKQESDRLEALMRIDLASIDSPLLSRIIDHALFLGGKRIRPILTCLSASLLGPAPAETDRLAICFEYLHAASLLHDDLIDHAELRRGRETANRLWGMEAVILAGDYLHAHAMSLAGEVGGRPAMRIIGRALSAMIESEFLQMAIADQIESSEELYLKVLQGKTAALIAAACEVGIHQADGNPAQGLAMVNYGHNLGLAFQMVDDLLDYLGDPAQTGKAVGNDFQEGKMTLPLLKALQNAPASDREVLLGLLQGPAEERSRHFAAGRELIAKNQGFTLTKTQAETLIREAVDGLALFEASPAKEALIGLAGYVLTRDK